MNTRGFKLTPPEQRLVNSILRKWEIHKKALPLPSSLQFKRLYKLLNYNEREIVEKILNFNPRSLGFKGVKYGIVPAPRRLAVIRNQRYCAEGKFKTIPPQLLPPSTFRAYSRLIVSMEKATGRKVLIESGYRSPAYQLIVFLTYLKMYKFKLRETARRVALPGYSQHSYPKGQAVDFVTYDGKPSEDQPMEFAETEEYRWLIKNARRFGFSLTYPKGNALGTSFEPWHWAHKTKH